MPVKVKRPIVFALELIAAMALSTVGAYLAAKIGGKLNAKANGDVRAGWAALENARATERIAAALERAYPAPRFIIPPVPTGHPELDADCSNMDRIRSLDAEESCALWGKKNPCKSGEHLDSNGYGVSCKKDSTPTSPLHIVSLERTKNKNMFRESKKQILIITQPSPDPCEDSSPICGTP